MVWLLSTSPVSSFTPLPFQSALAAWLPFRPLGVPVLSCLRALYLLLLSAWNDFLQLFICYQGNKQTNDKETNWTHLLFTYYLFPPLQCKGKTLASYTLSLLSLQCLAYDRCPRSSCRLTILRNKVKDRYCETLPREQVWVKGWEGS